ncbi:MAG: N-6 DNA methylase, partial [Acidobacteria bacterium]|nr:N-6 DNA methylase [Acidobacteriota bacterium]
MNQGFRGQLVSHDYAEHLLVTAFAGRLGEQARETGRRALMAWWAGDGRTLGPASSLRSVFDAGVAPVVEILGFAARSPRITARGDALVADASSDAGTWPLIVTPWGGPMDDAWPAVAREGLDRSVDWALCGNGRTIRLCDARHAHARAFLEFDLETVVDSPAAAVVLWGLLRPEALRSLTREVAVESARHGVAVAGSLRAGVHEALVLLLEGLASPRRRALRGRLDAARLEWTLDQALTVVYRVLFLLFAESRALVPMWHPVYRQSYTIDALRNQAERPGQARGIWEGLQALARLAHDGCRAGTLTVSPFNGRLFAPAHAPLAETKRLDDGLVARALMALTTHESGGRRERISFRDLGVEQLGAVYESVLDYEAIVVHGPGLGRAGPAAPEPSRSVQLVTRRDQRKSSGTFYTPQAITNHLVRRTLRPLVKDAGADEILRLRVLDPAMGSGAFLVAACQYLAAAYEQALVRDRGLFAADVDESDRAGFRRLVAQRCLYGVDLNATAVQVARLSMWLTTLAEGRPLSFLDHHLVCGDSLVGASLDDVARQPPGAARRATRRGGLPLFDEDLGGAALRIALPMRADLAMTPDDTADTVRRKERLLADMVSPSTALGSVKQLADLWCACWFWTSADTSRPGPAEFGDLANAIRGRRSALPDHHVQTWLAESQRLAKRHRFFHWTLEFPEVFFAADGAPSPQGGFDAILGNPPWEMLRGDTGNDVAREERRDLAGLLTRFVRQSGIYSACADGHVNQYQLFVERSVRLLRPGGRMGLVLPWGLASDHGSAGLRRMLLETCAVESVVGFENTEAIFPIHRGVRFLLLSASPGRPTGRIRATLGARSPDMLESFDRPPEGSNREDEVMLTPALLRRLSGPGLAFPYIRRHADLVMVERLAATFPPLSDDRGWSARFGRELNATDDRECFSCSPGRLPVVEGKHIDPFRVRLGDCGRWVRRIADLPTPHLKSAVTRPRLAYRDVASATNRLTLIAAVIPPGAVTVHTLFCLRTLLPEDDQWVLCSLLNRLIANFLVRLWVTTHLGTTTVERLPAPRLAAGSPLFVRLRDLARRVALEGDDRSDARIELQARALR